MAEIVIVLTSVDGERFTVENLLSMEWSKDVNAPCDSLSFSAVFEKSLPVIDKAELFLNGKKAFNGFVDTQRETDSEAEFKTYFYARSSACLLIDNEAHPLTCTKPCTASLFKMNAEQFGFKNKLLNLYSDFDYIVSKGVSCYGAINNFVFAQTGKNILINPENELYIPDNKVVKNVYKSDILSSRRLINRGGAVSQIDYKTENDLSYKRHVKSVYLEQQGIKRARKVNVSALPAWQRDYTLSKAIRTSVQDYISLEYVISGVVELELCDGLSIDSNQSGLEDFQVSSITVSLNSKGEKTRITLNKIIDLKEIAYVAE